MSGRPIAASDRGEGTRWPQILFLILAAALVRGTLFFLRGDYLDWDEALYLILARNLLDGAGLTLNGYPHLALGPLVPLATAALSRISGLEPLMSMRALMILTSALFVLPVWYLLKLHAGERIAAVGTVLLVGWTALIDVAPKLGPMWRHMYAGSEPAFLTLLFAALALGESGLRRRGRGRYGLIALAGVSLGLAYLARPEAVAVGVLYAFVRGVSLIRGGRARELTPGLAAAALGFLIVSGPYLLQLRQLADSWTLSAKLGPTRLTADLYQELVRDDRHMGAYLRSWWALDGAHARMVNPYWGIDGSAPMRERLADYRQALDQEWSPSAGALEAVGDRLGLYLLALWAVALPLFAPFALFGLIRCRRTLDVCFPPFVLAPLAASVLTAWQLFVLPRFYLYLVPALALWTGLGLVEAASLLRSRKLRVSERLISLLLLGAGLAVAAQRAVSAEASERRQLGFDDRSAAERLASLIPKGTPMMTWHPRLAVWGDFEWRALPVASLDGVVHYAVSSGVSHIFLARGAYSPLELEAPYVLITLDEQLVEAYRNVRAMGASHLHPAALLVPTDPVAGFPAGRVTLSPNAMDGE